MCCLPKQTKELKQTTSLTAKTIARNCGVTCGNTWPSRGNKRGGPADLWFKAGGARLGQRSAGAPPEKRGADSHLRRPFLDGDLEVVRHAHGKVGQIAVLLPADGVA